MLRLHLISYRGSAGVHHAYESAAQAPARVRERQMLGRVKRTTVRLHRQLTAPGREYSSSPGEMILNRRPDGVWTDDG